MFMVGSLVLWQGKSLLTQARGAWESISKTLSGSYLKVCRQGGVLDVSLSVMYVHSHGFLSPKSRNWILVGLRNKGWSRKA